MLAPLLLAAMLPGLSLRATCRASMARAKTRRQHGCRTPKQHIVRRSVIPEQHPLKGKSAIGIARNVMGRKRNFTGENFWARGYFVSTVGLDEEIVRRYIQDQEQQDARLEQLKLEYPEQPPSGGS